MSRILIVGAGLSGLTLARLAAERGHSVDVVETKHYLGGCCADQYVDGCFQHLHGPHIVHTNDNEVWAFLSRFTDWIPYRHRVWSNTAAGILPVPFFSDNTVDISDDRLQDLVFKSYSEKMWGTPWDKLPENIQKRVPSRGSAENPWYFQDRYQGLPSLGYTHLFGEMAKGLSITLGVSKMDWLHQLHNHPGKYQKVFCCRPHPTLPYRSLRFRRVDVAQPCPVLNDGTAENKYTRSTDYAQLTPSGPLANRCVVREYPCRHFQDTEPYYPDLSKCTEEQLKESMATYTRHGIIPLGRAATYQYLNMDQAVKQAMFAVERLL